ncbi:MAG: quinate 5-dehydrogenase [Chloroflexi bacterium]|nr:quinate 5-dehydrogenase [Chloroflexota bacterium]
MKKAVSISLGSSVRDKQVILMLNGEPIQVERIGTDGDEKRARALFAEYDGTVDVLGMGGVELDVRLGERSYKLSSGYNLVQDVRQTPVVNGAGLKHTLERRVFELAAPALGGMPHYKNAFMIMGVDRYGLAEAFTEVSDQVVFGDLMFALGIPIPIPGLSKLNTVGRILLPVLRHLPISMIYPTGEKQHETEPKYEKYWHQADAIGGDFLYCSKHMVDDLSGKTIVTNTTTEADIELLKARNLRWLITTTPRFEGRSFGTNVLEAALTAYAGKGRPLSDGELNVLIDELDLKPSVMRLDE